MKELSTTDLILFYCVGRPTLRLPTASFDTIRDTMYLKSIELQGFKSFGKKTLLAFGSPIAGVVGPNGSGKSNVAEAFRFVLGEQSMKSMRSKKGEDLIWGGSPALPRMNRASVKVTFDNSTRLLDIDFPEVIVERVVYRDGQNEYLLNGSQVRLKDIVRLLAGANIGGSGYQIISQGEADRILNASPKERREMVEDALGLKLYQHKKAESERKLEETGVNIEKTRSLRREIAPHLTFLRTQVERIEKARELKEELAVKLNEYLAREHAWITQEDSRLLEEARAEEAALKKLGEQVRETRGRRSHGSETALNELRAKIAEREGKLGEARRESEKLARELGRAEGAAEANTVTTEELVSISHVRTFAREVSDELTSAEHENDIGVIRSRLAHLRDTIRSFVEGLSTSAPETNEEAKQQVHAIAASLERVQKEERSLAEGLEALRKKIAEIREAGFAAERDLVELESGVREAQGRLVSVQSARAAVAEARRRFEEEVREGIVLVGEEVHGWERAQIPEGALSEDRAAQEKRRRELERLKIKIEESGIGNGDAVVQEFKQTKEREEYLAKELIDLEESAGKLKDIIADLEKTIDTRFRVGLKEINEALSGFFVKLFGGGAAKLSIEEPRRKMARSNLDLDDSDEDFEDAEEELYAGLSIDVLLPRKKVRGLEVLSGGERALTSIALIFSMSQVNPPPFLILDETDAALDEANSRRYADMIRELGKKSQLIVITHNRATMASAGELYGVTMSSDGVSKLLSVKLEEAERVAK
jgi:chromosome segregation ATPase